MSSLAATIEESLGMPMIFTLVSTLKDAAELIINERENATQAIKDHEAARAEEVENAKFHGTAVTRESFLEWHKDFQEEMRLAEEKEKEEKDAEDKKKRVKPEVKMTGKQLWEGGLVGKVDEEDMEGAEVTEITKGVEEIRA